MNPDIMLALKESTQDLHTQTEQKLPFFRPGFDQQDYIKTLQTFYGFYQSLENKLDAQTFHDESGRLRQKISWLERDFKALGVSPAEVQNIPLCEDVPLPKSPSEGVGLMYVIEGSTLGGQYVAKFLKQKLSIEPQTGAAFFYSYGDQTQENWREFQSLAREQVIENSEREQACQIARATFEKMDRWLGSQLQNNS